MRYAEKWPQYRDQWDRMIMNSDRVREFTADAQFALDHKATYQLIAAQAGQVTWAQIAIIHRREADADFNCYLGNGQSLHRVTTEVPRGRGPFATFTSGALDALRVDGLTSIIDWRLEKVLYFWEVFNGGGYSRRGLPSPYIFGGTNIQRRGKFVADDDFDATVWDSQPGCAPMLAMIMHLDPTVTFAREN